MYTFLVLGLIPGTNIQISFQAWLVIMAVVLIVGFKFKVYLKRYTQRLLYWGLAASPRLPLHANQLHHRVR